MIENYHLHFDKLHLFKILFMQYSKVSHPAWPNRQWYISRKNCINNNGFSRAPTFEQIFALILIILVNVLQAITLWKLENRVTQIWMGCLQGVLVAFTSILWFVVSIIDPTDQTQVKHLQAIYRDQYYNASDGQSMCSTCQTYTSKNTHHCRRCERCVQLFDHHCRWLNNCIGAKNYFQFIGLVLSLSLLLGFISSTSLFMIVQLKLESWQKYVCIVNCSFSLILFLPVLFLLLFHLCLIIRKKTTFELLLEVRKKSKEMENSEDSSCQNSEVKLGQIVSIPVQSVHRNSKFTRAQKLPELMGKKIEN